MLRSAGIEFLLAIEIRFASAKAILCRFEVGVGAAWLAWLVCLARLACLACLFGPEHGLEILLGGDDIPLSGRPDAAQRPGHQRGRRASCSKSLSCGLPQVLVKLAIQIHLAGES